MAGSLYWSQEQVARVVADSLKSTPERRRATFGEYYKAGIYTSEYSKAKRTAEIAEVDCKQQPAIHLVKDHGIYLMPNAWWQGIAVEYAFGFNPEKDDWWEDAREIMGGDDCVERIGLAAFEKALRSNLPWVRIDVTSTKLSIHCSHTNPLVTENNTDQIQTSNVHRGLG